MGIRLEFPLGAMEAGLLPRSGTHPEYTSYSQIFYILKTQAKLKAFPLLNVRLLFHLSVPTKSSFFILHSNFIPHQVHVPD